MDIPVTIANGTAFDEDLGESAILTIAFTTQNSITYKANSKLYFYAEITEDALSQIVCFEMQGSEEPLAAGTVSYVIENTSNFTSSATATGKVYYTAE